jgi:hypothetical protein
MDAFARKLATQGFVHCILSFVTVNPHYLYHLREEALHYQRIGFALTFETLMA